MNIYKKLNFILLGFYYTNKNMNKFQNLKTCFVRDITSKLNIAINFTSSTTITYLKTMICRESNKRYSLNSFRLIKNNQELNDWDMIGDRIQDGDKLFVIGKLKRNINIMLYYSNHYLTNLTINSKMKVKEFKDKIKKILDEDFNIKNEKYSFSPNQNWIDSFMWIHENNNLLEEYFVENYGHIYINSLMIAE